jgi:hypothetical protein
MASVQLSTAFLMAALEGMAPAIKAAPERRILLNDALRRAGLAPFCAGGPERIAVMPERIPDLFRELAAAVHRSAPAVPPFKAAAVSVSHPRSEPKAKGPYNKKRKAA